MNLTIRRVVQMLKAPMSVLYEVEPDNFFNKRVNIYDRGYQDYYDFSETKNDKY